MITQGCILVVDDDPDCRDLVAEILSQAGFHVETADNAYDAIGKLRDLHPDLMLTDLEMPGMDGIELIERVRAPSRTDAFGAESADEQRPAILMTAGWRVAREEARRRGAADVLVKPLDPDHLISVVRRTMAPHAPLDAGAAAPLT